MREVRSWYLDSPSHKASFYLCKGKERHENLWLKSLGSGCPRGLGSGFKQGGSMLLQHFFESTVRWRLFVSHMDAWNLCQDANVVLMKLRLARTAISMVYRRVVFRMDR